ncbi:MAG: DEAD/DEAH box helicase family protein [Nostoc sp.]|uniref:DEAD/DEAH box helicase family protein n=1 Tax=Nostoc sp. TaxID=1180 RepID=UPI002FFA5AE3
MEYKEYESFNLEQLRKKDTHFSPKPPFQHQVEAFKKLSSTFKLDSKEPRSGLLVLPTGAGKTFTAVKWSCDHVIPKNIKILWLAPSFYLLDQAFSTFCENARDISHSKKTLNIRRVSSNPSHANASSIQLTDDIVIMTIQTAISNLHPDALDGLGNKVGTAFRKFIEDSKETGLFVIVDEAHHSPAYGCRNLLIGEKGLRELVPNCNILGLTATPTYTDKARRGWLRKIFQNGDNGVIYQADKETLIAQGILARPNYIEVSTSTKMEVDDKLYDRLFKQHKDLPESIIGILADNKDRNNFIVNSYVSKKDTYGKTIIFADRWFQCEHIKNKLVEKGIKADAIYSRIDADPGSADARNKRKEDDNRRILDDFKSNKLDVLINVRMLTEGVDVPNVQTVFITRQTTSSILVTQMIGRALRGKRAGGSSEANVILFFDDWKRLIDWVDPRDGGTKPDDEKPEKAEHYPLEYISIRLIEELSKSIENNGVYPIEYKKIFPIGWYKTEIVYADSDNNNDSMEAFIEFVMVYEHTQSKFETFISSITDPKLLDEWSKEYLNDEWMQPKVKEWIDKYFDYEADNMGRRLSSDLIKIVRHIAQDNLHSTPPYHSFEEREIYDLDKIAHKLINFTTPELHKYVNQEFSKPGMLWETFYKTPNRLLTALQLVINKIITDGDGSIQPLPPSTHERKNGVRELQEPEKEQVKRRDAYACLCCGVKTEAKLQIDHIKPFIMGGETSVENSQTLCIICNRCKGKNEIDFRCKTTKLSIPKNLDLSSRTESQYSIRTLTRIVNLFYHCKAVDKIEWERSTRGYCIYLYPGNNCKWLLQHKAELLKYIQEKLDRQAYNIEVTTIE